MKLSVVNRKDEKKLAIIFFTDDIINLSRKVTIMLTRIAAYEDALSDNIKDLNEYDKAYFEKETQLFRKAVLKQFFRFMSIIHEGKDTGTLENEECRALAILLKLKFSLFVDNVAPELEVMLPLITIE